MARKCAANGGRELFHLTGYLLKFAIAQRLHPLVHTYIIAGDHATTTTSPSPIRNSRSSRASAAIDVPLGLARSAV
ncbi:hypothetical protein RB195_005034 [Necator americanus]|uniref:Uncharacterized protein n=1 Tax=Necator americanus TaxID=51031 RepID=A0ABR1BP69_NECAM